MSSLTFCEVYKCPTFNQIQKLSIDSPEDVNSDTDECLHPAKLTMIDGRTWQVKNVSDADIGLLMANVKALNKTIDFGHNVNEQHFEDLSPFIETEFASSGLQNSSDAIAKLYLHRVFKEATEVKGESQEDAAPPEAKKIDAKKIDLQAEMKKKDVKDSEWKSTALAIAIIAAIIIAAVVVVGGLITGFVFTCIYCPIAAYVIGCVAAVVVIKAISLGVFLFMRSHR